MLTRCKHCNKFYSQKRKSQDFCSVKCAASEPRLAKMSVKELQEREKHIQTLKKAKLRRRLNRMMDNYWLNYVDGEIIGRQASQVAPALSYALPRNTRTIFGKMKFRKLEDMVQSPEDLAWVQDPEGVMLGKYDF